VTSIPASHVDLLTRALLANLATVRPDGDPAVTPMWFSWDGELIRFTHTTARRKLRNIAHNPHVALAIVDPDRSERYLQVRGAVECVEPDPSGAFFVELAIRYGAQDPSPPPDAADRVVLAVRPFAHSTYG
jgi:PPOX class probable F420-dependent enzyme